MNIPYFIRSYDHSKRKVLDSERPLNAQSTSKGIQRARTGLSTTTQAQRAKKNEESLREELLYGNAARMEVWQAARGATAAGTFFAPLEMKNKRAAGYTSMTDGSSTDANNPSKVIKEDIEDLHGLDSIGIIVSIGTARKMDEGKTKRPSIFTLLHHSTKLINQVTDPEPVHLSLKRESENNEKFPYYRLNHLDGLRIALDDWRPIKIPFGKKPGSKTIETIENAFNKWARANTDKVQECADILVECRRRRMDTSRWSRYATSSQFSCPFSGCDRDPYHEASKFRTHLCIDHGLREDEVDEEIVQCRRDWRYQAPPPKKNKWNLGHFKKHTGWYCGLF